MELVLIQKPGKLGLFKDISIYTKYVRNDLDLFKKKEPCEWKKDSKDQQGTKAKCIQLTF